jgi:hypothetical protein
MSGLSKKGVDNMKLLAMMFGLAAAALTVSSFNDAVTQVSAMFPGG